MSRRAAVRRLGLDVGGGHARLAPPLAEAGYRVTVMGSQRLVPPTSSGRCRFDVANLLALPYADQAFEAVVCYRLLAHSIGWRQLDSTGLGARRGWRAQRRALPARWNSQPCSAPR